MEHACLPLYRGKAGEHGLSGWHNQRIGHLVITLPAGYDADPGLPETCAPQRYRSGGHV
ncbi:hypothetical protein SXCC_03214 [Gluconacetobacter sp. SXCC-1]|nr:hypothetical protein SXCC_03214 [Gluconacetobacter sp. SXCC-1]